MTVEAVHFFNTATTFFQFIRMRYQLLVTMR